MFAMVENAAKKYISGLLKTADIEINGSRPWDIQVKNDKFFLRVFTGGSLGLGESYVDGWWECNALDIMIYKLLIHKVENKIHPRANAVLNYLKSKIINCQSRRRAFEVGERHYDAGNDLFEAMLDSHMVYSCGYWKKAENLDQAQEKKLDLICRKLRLEPGMRLLDIGCGWGGLARYAASRFGVSVVGVTISKEQAELARRRCRKLPVEIRLEDYREVSETFDAIVSVGMFEHVGYKNYRDFMKVVRRCLHKEGLFLLHTIASNTTVYNCDPWFNKYIFPNGMLPSLQQFGSAIEDFFVMENWQNLGVHYDQTLMAWYANFERNWQKLKACYCERFHRMWRYYLLVVAGAFRARELQVWQVVLAPEGIPGGYSLLQEREFEVADHGTSQSQSGQKKIFQ